MEEKGQPEYSNLVCAFDNQHNLIRVWQLGTGKLIEINKLEEQSYADFKFHCQWENFNLIYKTYPSITKLQMKYDKTQEIEE